MSRLLFSLAATGLLATSAVGLTHASSAAASLASTTPSSLSTFSSSSSSHSSHSSLIFATTPEQQAYIHSRFASNPQVGKIRQSIPRWGKTSDFQANSDYAMSLAYTTAPAVAFFAVTLILWMLYAIFSCFCCKSNPKGYTQAQIRVPMIFGTLCSFVVIAFCIIGIMSSASFSNNISGQNGVGQITMNVLSHVDGFFEKMNNSINAVSTQANQLAPNIQAKVDNFTDLGSGLAGVLIDLRAFAKEVRAIDPIVVDEYDSGAQGGAQNTSFPCAYCSSAATQIETIANGIDSQATPIFNQVASTKKAAMDEVVKAVPKITSGIADVTDQVNDIRSKASKYQSTTSDYRDQVDKYESQRKLAVMFIFGIPMLLVLMFWVCSLMMKSECCSKLLVHLLFFVGLLMWLMFLIHLPTAVVMSDSCAYLDKVDVDLEGQTSLPSKVAAPLSACLAQQNLLDAMNVTGNIDFTKSVVFPVVPDVSALLTVAPLQELNLQIQALNISAFGYDPNTKLTLLVSLNNQTYTAPWFDLWDMTNVSNCLPVKYGVFKEPVVRSLKNSIMTSAAVEVKITDTLASLKQNMTGVMHGYNVLVNNTNQLLNVDMQGLKGVIQPLLDSANNVRAQSTCQPLDQDYGDMKSVFCDKMIISIGGIAMSAFFTAIFLFGINFACWFLGRSLQHGPDSQKNGGMGLAQSILENGVTIRGRASVSKGPKDAAAAGLLNVNTNFIQVAQADYMSTGQLTPMGVAGPSEPNSAQVGDDNGTGSTGSRLRAGSVGLEHSHMRSPSAGGLPHLRAPSTGSINTSSSKRYQANGSDAMPSDIAFPDGNNVTVTVDTTGTIIPPPPQE